MNKKPLISIVTPVYNNKKYIGRALNSIFRQSYDNWELIIVDDGSTDGTGELVDEIAKTDERIRIIHQDNQWIYASMNNGVKLANGRYVYILNSDDELIDDSLKLLASKIEEYNNPDIIWTDVEQVIVQDEKEKSRRTISGGLEEKVAIRKEDIINLWGYIDDKLLNVNQANLYKRELLIDNPFRNDIYGADYILNNEIYPQIGTFVIMKSPVYRFYVHDKENTSFKYWDYTHEMYNEFFSKTKKMLEDNGSLTEENYKRICNRRIDNFIGIEIPSYDSNSCSLSVEQKVTNIFKESYDSTLLEALKETGRYDYFERSLIRAAKRLLINKELDESSDMKFVNELIELIPSKMVSEIIIKRLEEAVYNVNNLWKVGESYYKRALLRYSNKPIEKNKNAKRVLWLCNIVLPEICDQFLFKRAEIGGWIDGLWQNVKNDPAFYFAICVPIQKVENCQDGEIDNYRYYSFFDSMYENKILEMQRRFEDIIDDFKPDVIHIWGTEYLHTYSMIRAAEKCGLLGHIMVHIQGIVSAYYNHLYSGLTQKMINDNRLIKSIEDYYDDFKNRSEYEKKSLVKVPYILGRTDWDKTWTSVISCSSEYHHVGEILRKEIYENAGTWDVKNCIPKTIFISQASYPIKGLHLIINSLARLKNIYSELKVRIAGANPLYMDNLYGEYIREMILSMNLEDTIEFIGFKKTAEMVEEYRKANVYLSSSIIENSPNSLCEAMLIGTPVISSNVGGVNSLVTSGKDGYLYSINEMEVMEKYIQEIFGDERLATSLSKNAVLSMSKKMNIKDIVSKMIKLYREV